MNDDRATSEQLAHKLRIALAMSGEGIEMKRLQLERRHPEADAADIDRLLRAWLQERPGAEHGDGIGRLVSWPRPRR